MENFEKLAESIQNNKVRPELLRVISIFHAGFSAYLSKYFRHQDTKARS